MSSRMDLCSTGHCFAQWRWLGNFSPSAFLCNIAQHYRTDTRGVIGGCSGNEARSVPIHAQHRTRMPRQLLNGRRHRVNQVVEKRFVVRVGTAGHEMFTAAGQRNLTTADRPLAIGVRIKYFETSHNFADAVHRPLENLPVQAARDHTGFVVAKTAHT